MLIPAALFAQPTASLHGTVLDPSGAAVPKASVTATGPNNAVKVGETDENGAFALNGLQPGTYTVRVIASGFGLLEKTGVELPAGRPVTFEGRLTMAAEKQEVTVADTQQVELDPAKNAGALVLKEEDLDMLSDDPDDLQNDLLALAGPSAGPNGGQIFIDGFSNGQLPPKESIREIRINSNPFSAEFDTQGHGRIEIFTKPGTDKFHGAVNLNYSDWIFNARNPFDTTGKPFSDTKNMQANVNGPLSKKASFFLEFSRRQQREAALVNVQELDSGCASLTFLTPCNPLSNAFGLVAPNTFTNISPRVDYQLTTNITLQARYSLRKTDAENNGVGGISLPNSGSNNTGTNQQVQLTETWIVNPKTINETRYQYARNRSNNIGIDPELNIVVNSAFDSGSNYPLSYAHTDSHELQNYTSITHGSQFIKFGARIRGNQYTNYSENNFPGQFTFLDLTSYAIMQQGIAQHIPLSQIIAAGGGPSQFNIATGNPLLGESQVDAGLFVQDDWRLKPSLTLSLGMRYEIQNNISDKGDLAPRIGLAWGIGPQQGRLRAPKMVLRAGAGYFYDRFSVQNVLNADRFNGTNQVNYTVTNPQFFPGAGVPLPPVSSLPVVSSATYHIDDNLKAPRILQSAIGLDRQLPKNITVSFNYIHTRGLNQLRTYNINTPFIGTYAGPGTGVYPLTSAAGIYDLYSTSGDFKQNQFMFNANARINSRISLFGFYVYGRAYTNVIGQPSNPYNFNADWGRANYDQRHRVNINGSVLAPFGLRFSPNITYNSAGPFNITQGVDQFGDSLYNTRPAFEPAGFAGPVCTPALTRNGSTPCLVSTSFGNFVVNPTQGMRIIPVNYGSAFGQFNFNVRVSRSWGWGERASGNNQRPGGGRGGSGGGFGPMAGPRGGRGGGPPPGMGGMMGGGDVSGKKYTLTAGLFAHNLFNNVNPGLPEGNLLSPRFGDSLGLAGGGFGGFGGGANAAQAFNRRIEITLRFSF
ncbi:MAG: carboxypeptidase regulatory-like domain-containing protein [Acidobacteriia bacterium]|nr:carboxypeptidase regulatory-like domain-containing protein [Terriglobia bacterium]